MFGQLINLLDKEKIAKISRKNGGERYIKKFDLWQHLSIMFYAVIKRYDSLREIAGCMLPEARKLAHLGISVMPKRSTLSDANARRPECVFEAVNRDLYERYRKELSSDSLTVVVSMSSSLSTQSSSAKFQRLLTTSAATTRITNARSWFATTTAPRSAATMPSTSRTSIGWCAMSSSGMDGRWRTSISATPCAMMRSTCSSIKALPANNGSCRCSTDKTTMTLS